MVRYSKAQRPTSLPIQPFVLVPDGKPQAQHLGCLLEQYMNQKSGKAAAPQPPGSKFKGKRSQCFSNLQLSPMGSQYPIFLEAPSSSDTCSTCTPSPECFSRRHTWSQSSRSQRCLSPLVLKSLDATRSSSPKLVETSPRSGTTLTLNVTPIPSEPGIVKIPSYQDLISLTPEQSGDRTQPGRHAPSQTHTSYDAVFSHTPPTLPLTADGGQNDPVSPPRRSQPEQKPPLRRAEPAADGSFFFHSSLTAALSSVAPLSSLLSLAASGLQPQHSQADCAGLGGKSSQSQHSESLILSDRPPTEFCLSPDTSYESMSISHLQRRGEATRLLTLS